MSVFNNEFAKTDFCFKAACDRAGIPATGRQAGKYRRHVGAAWGNRPTVVDLSSLTCAALRDRLATMGIEAPKRAVKSALVALLRGE